MALLPSSPYWQPTLGELGACVTGLDELSQAIRIVITTPKGSVPLRPDFGCDLLAFLDMPQPLATSRMIREIGAALARWEPRISVQEVEVSNLGFGQAEVRITWSPKGTTDDVALSTVVSLAHASDTTSSSCVPTSTVGKPGGVAPLDAAGLIPESFLPASTGSGTGGEVEVPASIDAGEIV